jgi:hypothetical protein
MMSKHGYRDVVVPEMRDRLLVNRHGRLHPGQWIDMIMAPVITLLALIVPLGFFVLPRLFLALRLGGLVVALILLAAVAYTVLSRAYRYARAPVYFAVMNAPGDVLPGSSFWRGLTLTDAAGGAVRFRKRLAPAPRLKRGEHYLVYFLREPAGNVLLSIAPESHAEVEGWRPSSVFEARFKRRTATTRAADTLDAKA